MDDQRRVTPVYKTRTMRAGSVSSEHNLPLGCRFGRLEAAILWRVTTRAFNDPVKLLDAALYKKDRRNPEQARRIRALKRRSNA
jgi:hypothetical protein